MAGKFTSGDKSQGGTNPIPQGPPPGAPYEAMQVMQCLMEIQKDIGSLTTKVDRLVGDVAKLDDHVDKVRSKIGRAEGVVIGCTILLTVIGGAIWWLVGGEINQLRDQLYRLRAESLSTPADSAASSPSSSGSQGVPSTSQSPD